jgi:nitric oxide reductase NorE protein
LSEVASPTAPAPLSGGVAVWVFMTVEVVTFGMFLLAFAWSYGADPATFAAAQARLHPESALRGTALLLLASGFAYQAVLAHAERRLNATSRWMAAAAAAGLAFSVNKLLEYADPSLAGLHLSSGGFWFSYFFLTGLHLLHVLGGIAFFGWLAGVVRRAEVDRLTVEAGAAYWHLVDLIWVLLFPILYLMRA